ncbi:MAG: hypothetical protein A3B86_03915 [Candidatus Yanofskybacteria bacterium RIFCSPHIGHO2_02_FULL_38_22b]|uniref:DUF86 domain-containing protein n=1 Tax=Candidatus Yanofskybacteria bacterium RIFCSPHIGHO2_02_FULL_38_22b TaxID=1802673 RepID=A0A1F8EZD8_9BACT|nr:MAG: hypothetical protein A2816_01685 [Candidatus Yanofskybacteria bacterium RIFCSPHIGHO2_01_FULL_39_44]OGN06237.1 MAG: hypothetical protein A3B86_03915 [Candidatus Yanofskybacteria bacterium RIFCSPHIGHO2_02_FULL_38_22b]OGN19657.1 MAG: hypothetical protein A2910_03650 [Candidatus Yanofskybacteria bacterium RIFCSPLOWO2_01_FULL_39_28]
MTFNEAFIWEKLTEITKYQEELKQHLKFSDQEILGDTGKMHIAERIFQLIVDLMLDINSHFIKELNLEIADDFQGTFYILGKHNVLDADFAQKVAPIVGIRNRIVHGYEKLDKERFVNELRQNYRDFDRYIESVRNYLHAKTK